MIIEVENMTWSPIHVTQRLQDHQTVYDRTVLIGSSAGCLRPGNVVVYKWIGGEMSTLKLQERVYEGVTGVVSLDNTLVIGDYFKVWPKEVFTVEVDLPGDAFGEIVMAENMGSKEEELLKILGFNPDVVRKKIADLAWSVAQYGASDREAILDKSVNDLVDSELFTKYEFKQHLNYVN
jgi:RNase P/RNase MRP subunit p29